MSAFLICEGADAYINKFIPCHMPIDRIELVWYCYEKGKLYEGWYRFDEDLYEIIQQDIRDIVGGNVLDNELVILGKFKDRIIKIE